MAVVPREVVADAGQAEPSRIEVAELRQVAGERPLDEVGIGQLVEDLADRLASTLVFLRCVRPEIDAFEHKPTQREHRRSDVLALEDSEGLLLHRGEIERFQVELDRHRALAVGEPELDRRR